MSRTQPTERRRMNETMLDPKQGWIPAREEPYYPSVFEKIKHFLGFHIWTIDKPYRCVICKKMRKQYIEISKTSGGVFTNGNGHSHKTISVSFYKIKGNGDNGVRSLSGELNQLKEEGK